LHSLHSFQLDRFWNRQPGCQIFLGAIYQNVEKYTKFRRNIEKLVKIYQNGVEYTKMGKTMPKWSQKYPMAINCTKLAIKL
jgi:hypothetical protein